MQIGPRVHSSLDANSCDRRETRPSSRRRPRPPPSPAPIAHMGCLSACLQPHAKVLPNANNPHSTPHMSDVVPASLPRTQPCTPSCPTLHSNTQIPPSSSPPGMIRESHDSVLLGRKYRGHTSCRPPAPSAFGGGKPEPCRYKLRSPAATPTGHPCRYELGSLLGSANRTVFAWASISAPRRCA